MRSRLLLVALSFAFVTAPSVTSRAQPDDVPPNSAAREADVHVKQGQALAEAGHYDAAIAQFRAASALVPRADVQFFLAETYRAKGDKPAALRGYNAYLEAAGTGAFAETARMRVDEMSAQPTPHKRAWRRIIDRPLTLEEGQIGGNVRLARDGGWYRPRGQQSGSWEFATRIGVGGGYGISDDVTLGGTYAGGTKLVRDPDPATGLVRIGRARDTGGAAIYAAYRIAHGSSYSVAANVVFSENVEENKQGVALGLSARYRLSSRLAVFTGNSPIAPTYSSKVNWMFNDGGTAAFSISAGIECQWTPRFYMLLTGNASYAFVEPATHSITTSLLTYVTINEHIDIGAYLDPSSFGLDVRVFR